MTTGVSPLITDYDLYLFGEGNHTRIYDRLGAHLITVDGVEGVHFAVWAPNASRVSVVGDFNNWDGRTHVMQQLAHSGVWASFVPEAQQGHRYKYELQARSGDLILKADPYAFAFELPPATASVVCRPEYT
jgi:1,4-alpha-glucan branching enzyme